MSDQSSQKMEKIEVASNTVAVSEPVQNTGRTPEEHMAWSAAVREEREAWNRANAGKNAALRVANVAYQEAYDKVWIENANLTAAIKAGTEAYENSLREAGYESKD
jgi:hypothetical protein